MDSAYNIHSRVQPCPADEYVLLLNNSSHLNVVTLREAEWTYRGLQHMLVTMYQWSVNAFSSGLCNIPTPVNQVLHGRIVQTNVKIDTLCEQRWPSEYHPGMNSGNILHPLCHVGPLGTVYLQQDSDHVCLWPGYHIHHNITQQDLLWCRERVNWIL